MDQFREVKAVSSGPHSYRVWISSTVTIAGFTINLWRFILDCELTMYLTISTSLITLTWTFYLLCLNVILFVCILIRLM